MSRMRRFIQSLTKTTVIAGSLSIGAGAYAYPTLPIYGMDADEAGDQLRAAAVIDSPERLFDAAVDPVRPRATRKQPARVRLSRGLTLNNSGARANNLVVPGAMKAAQQQSNNSKKPAHLAAVGGGIYVLVDQLSNSGGSSSGSRSRAAVSAPLVADAPASPMSVAPVGPFVTPTEWTAKFIDETDNVDIDGDQQPDVGPDSDGQSAADLGLTTPPPAPVDPPVAPESFTDLKTDDPPAPQPQDGNTQTPAPSDIQSPGQSPSPQEEMTEELLAVTPADEEETEDLSLADASLGEAVEGDGESEIDGEVTGQQVGVNNANGAVPEPATAALALAGLGVLGLRSGRRRTRA